MKEESKIIETGYGYAVYVDPNALDENCNPKTLKGPKTYLGKACICVPYVPEIIKKK